MRDLICLCCLHDGYGTKCVLRCAAKRTGSGHTFKLALFPCAPVLMCMFVHRHTCARTSPPQGFPLLFFAPRYAQRLLRKESVRPFLKRHWLRQRPGKLSKQRCVFKESFQSKGGSRIASKAKVGGPGHRSGKPDSSNQMASHGAVLV